MSGKKMGAGLLILAGAFIGASTKSNVWDAFPFWVWLLVLFVAVLICGVAMDMWRSAGGRKS